MLGIKCVSVVLLALPVILTACSGAAPSTEGQGDASKDEASDPAAQEVALEAVTCGDIKRIHRFGDIYLAGQPSEADFEQVKDAGVQLVINQRPDGEHADFNEEEVVTALGMAYRALAWNGADQLTDQMLDDTREAFRSATGPMLIHCASANRTGATWLAYAALDRGLSWEDALAEAKTVGLRSGAYEEVVQTYVEARR